MRKLNKTNVSITLIGIVIILFEMFYPIDNHAPTTTSNVIGFVCIGIWITISRSSWFDRVDNKDTKDGKK